MKETDLRRLGRGAAARVVSLRRKNRERNRRIVQLRQQGMPVASIACLEGLTRQAVYNVLRANAA